MINRTYFKTTEMNIMDVRKCLKLSALDTEQPPNDVICGVESIEKPKCHVGNYDLEVSSEIIISIGS